MKKILFLTNYPSPYRTHFFNELGKKTSLIVLFTESIEKQEHRNSSWFDRNYEYFRAVFLEKTVRVGKYEIKKDILPFLKDNYDMIYIGGYSSLTNMVAIEYLSMHRIPFCMEVDGGIIKKDGILRFLIKKHFISKASYYMSTSQYTDEYLKQYGAKGAFYRYPLTTLYSSDILKTGPSIAIKNDLRNKLHISESRMVVSVGQFVHRKGYDVLIKAAAMLPNDVGIYIIGDEPKEDYLELRKELLANNVHFVGFKTKDKLLEYYDAADLFALPTREDIWGLVVNEAMARGLPVVTTERCVAGLELVENDKNGYIVPADNPQSLSDAIMMALPKSLKMGEESLQKIQKYCFEEMAEAHIQMLQENS